MNVKTHVARNFLNLIDKHFPKTNKLHKIINRNTIKVRYNCLPNVKQRITNHNKHLLQGNNNKKEISNSVKLCNCRGKASCPLNGECLAKCVIYKATVTETTTKNQESYTKLIDNEFKTRYNQPEILMQTTAQKGRYEAQ